MRRLGLGLRLLDNLFDDLRSRAGVKTVSISLAVLAATAGIQVAIFALSGSVALLADLIHNFGDALTAVPLGIAFFLRSSRGEKLAGLAVVLAIFVSACVALYETIQRLIHPQHLSHLWVLAAAGAIGFLGNEITGQKPVAFCHWIFDLLGLTADDELVDIFPGSGAVGRAWDSWRAQTRLAV